MCLDRQYMYWVGHEYIRDPSCLPYTLLKISSVELMIKERVMVVFLKLAEFGLAPTCRYYLSH